MAAEIEMPDGTPAMIEDGVWYFPDPRAIPVLEYFTERIVGEAVTNYDSEVAREVVTMMVGARFIYSDPPEPLLPGGKS